jgi:lipoate-protein ligase A
VDLDRNLVSGLLNHPTKEPDYRKGRSHKDFLTCLTEVTANISSSEEVAKVLSTGYDSAIKNLLGDHLIDSIDAQKNALTARLARSGAL